MLPLHSSTLKPTQECKVEYHGNAKVVKHDPDPITHMVDAHSLHKYGDKMFISPQGRI